MGDFLFTWIAFSALVCANAFSAAFCWREECTDEALGLIKCTGLAQCVRQLA
jgi:hypothetical protein